MTLTTTKVGFHLQPVQIVISVNTTHINAMLHSNNGLRPTRSGKKANATLQAKLNIWLVAVIRVCWSSVVTPAEVSMECR